VMFFVGDPVDVAPGEVNLTARVPKGIPFFVMFAICFPAFTGMTAGVGLSGDLKRPSRSIPLGTLLATAVGMLVYFGIVYKLTISASPRLLADDQLVMSRIAIWGPIIPIGLGCATLSSAIGSILVAPRTLQALGKDACFPLGKANRWLASGKGESNEPRTATLVTSLIALVVVALGDVNFVARIISMFFMVTYGALCAISFLEHFAANPSYRPNFRSRWYISLFGAVMCLLMMWQMDPIYTVVAVVAMMAFYYSTRFTDVGRSSDNLAALFAGAMRQAIRRMHIRLQRGKKPTHGKDWRPSIVLLSSRTFTGSRSPLELLGWLCERHGFGTYLHYIEGFLNDETFAESQQLEQRLVQICQDDFPGVFVDTMVSPSPRSALAQVLQAPGVSGMENNTVLFELAAGDPLSVAEQIADQAVFSSVARKNLLVLRHSQRNFGAKRRLHVWLTWHDAKNATLLVLLTYILVGHSDWAKAELSIFAAFPNEQVSEEHRHFVEMLSQGRMPISPSNIKFHSVNTALLFASWSRDARLKPI